MDDQASHGAPGTDLVPLGRGPAVPRELVVAADVALGAGALAVTGALRAATAGLGLVRAGARVATALPGGRLAAGVASAAVQPLAERGAAVRSRAQRDAVAETQRLLEVVVPEIVRLVDVDGIVRRIDVDALLRRSDVEALLARVDLDALIGRVDVDAIADRIDVNAIVQRVDVEAVVEETELGTIVARSTSGFASEALDAARAQTVGADTLVTRIVDRLLRRRGEGPLGPPLLVGEEPGEAVEPEAPAPPAAPEPPGPIPPDEAPR